MLTIQITPMDIPIGKYLLLIVIFISASLAGQEFTPVVSQFTKKDYNASNQNWAVGQSKNGIMCFGNNQGLVEFDGSLWQTHHIAENKNSQVIQKKIVPDDELNKVPVYFAHTYRVSHFKSDLYWFIRDVTATLTQVKTGTIKALDVVQQALFLN
jgi:hypothetical protein